ncbi:MAG: M24 family metallopeptidase [Candidatus Zixiibacteriota bacterium]|nr:MAG: M24 family metallopeptidase [candidate division Zixibacteria bacterium]
MEIVKEKIDQTVALLDELGLDCWIVFVRETAMASDPALPMVVGHDVVWQSFFIYTRGGEAIALVGNFDQENFKRSGCFTEVHAYTKGVSQDFRKILNRIDPEQVAVNFSTDNVAADGLSHGMFLLLQDYLKKTPYAERLVSAEELISKLRSRKLPSELALLEKAATLADEAWQKAVDKIKPGMTERQIGDLIDDLIRQAGDTPSFPTIVNAGSKSAPGHSLPTDAKVERGDLLHVDFGVRHDNFCSDIQRLVYFKRPSEASAPEGLQRAFDTVSGIITETATLCKPGVKGYRVDSRARQRLKEAGYPEYQHALGHQLGRDVHDGGAIIGPCWERYGVTPTIPLEAGNAFTLELEIMLPETGCAGLEEDVAVTDAGARFLGPRQTELTVK